ncbi:B-cell receptor-associated protein 31-like [Aricia agestis]|uniref:B-cell receptor-associated protein 31-like n=1 Tax=Aricia agestis TaxID=91739 RepID=UPI001C20A54B|nr:B-cell receptor-associated protein 31-like [Aricia agestis]XP_041980770.1 B-cell receptor-associated protein 31-like [Aricia agestis]
MSIQWTFIAGYLYFEIAIVIIMILPIFSPRRWYNFFRSRLFSMFREHAAVYFYVLLGVLALFLLDAVREMKKYSHSSDHVHLASEMKGNVKLFRAQRNFYITGFAIFLAFVIKRLVTMIIIQYELQLKADAIIKKADETVKQAKTAVLANTIQDGMDLHKENEDLKNEIATKNSMLEEQKMRIKELEEETIMLKAKYEDIRNGEGDN